jgi:hypothetical protein
MIIQVGYQSFNNSTILFNHLLNSKIVLNHLLNYDTTYTIEYIDRRRVTG